MSSIGKAADCRARRARILCGGNAREIHICRSLHGVARGVRDRCPGERLGCAFRVSRKRGKHRRTDGHAERASRADDSVCHVGRLVGVHVADDQVIVSGITWRDIGDGEDRVVSSVGRHRWIAKTWVWSRRVLSEGDSTADSGTASGRAVGEVYAIFAPVDCRRIFRVRSEGHVELNRAALRGSVGDKRRANVGRVNVRVDAAD